MKIIAFLVILILSLLFWMLLVESWGSPWLVSDPSPGAIGGEFEVWETTVNRRMTYQSLFMVDWNEDDGSICMDLANTPVGTHQWQVRYNVNGELSGFAPCTLAVTQSCVTVHRHKTCTKFYKLTP